MPLLDGTKKLAFVTGFAGMLITPALGGGRFGDEFADFATGSGGLLGAGLEGLLTSGMPKPKNIYDKVRDNV